MGRGEVKHRTVQVTHTHSGVHTKQKSAKRWRQSKALLADCSTQQHHCNSVLSSTPKKIMDKLQRVQNATARLVTGTQKYERGLSPLMYGDLHWLVIPQRAQYTSLLFHRCLRQRALISSTTVCQSPKFLVDSICDVPEVINCQFLEFAVEPLRPVHFLLPDQQFGIHCLIIRAMQLLTLNNSGRT